MYYDSDKRLQEGNGDAALVQPAVFIFTKNIIDAVKRAAGMAKLTDYATLRQVVGLDSLAFSQAVYNALTEFVQYDANSLLSSNCGFFTPVCISSEHQNEIDRTIKPMSKTEQNIHAAKDFLNPVTHDHGLEACLISDFKKEKAVPYYHIEIYLNNVYISVEEGFLKAMEEKPSRLEFFSSVLKALYSVSRINNVNRSAWYRKYLEVLGASV